MASNTGNTNTHDATPTEGNKKSKKNEAKKREEYLAAQVEDLRERFLYLIEMWSADTYRYEWLESHTGISAARWQNVLLEKQFPTPEMMVAICDAQPGYSYWFLRGTSLAADDPLFKTKMCSPSEESFSAFKAHREWIKEKRRSKAEKKSEKGGTVQINHGTKQRNVVGTYNEK